MPELLSLQAKSNRMTAYFACLKTTMKYLIHVFQLSKYLARCRSILRLRNQNQKAHGKGNELYLPVPEGNNYETNVHNPNI